MGFSTWSQWHYQQINQKYHYIQMKNREPRSAEEEKSLQRLAKKKQEVPVSFNSQSLSKLKFPMQIKNQNSHTIWAPAQIDLLFSAYRQIGSKWTDISKRFEAKSENCVKNKFYGTLRKTVRGLNSIFRQNCHKSKKQIPFKSVMKIFEYSEGKFRIQEDLFVTSTWLREKILLETVKQSIQLDIQQIEKLMKEINSFNFRIRSFKALKKNKTGTLEKEKQPKKRPERNNKLKVHEAGGIQCKEEGQQQEQMQILGSLTKQNKKNDQILFRRELQHHEKENFLQVELVNFDQINWERYTFRREDDCLFSQNDLPLSLPSQPNPFI